jgi:hypothetical protein
MDALPNNALVAAALAPLDESRALQLTALPVTTQPSFHLTHPYFEIVYAPTLGPSAVLLGRYLGRVLAAHDNETILVCPAALSREVGMRSNSDDPLGARSLLRRSIERLEHDRIVRWLEPQHLGVVTSVPAVSERVRDKLPAAARRTHDHFVDVIDLRDEPRSRTTGRDPSPAEPAAGAPKNAPRR